MDIVTHILYTIIGMFAGLSMGIIGVGAGIITIPALVYSGMNIHTAVGCSLVMQLLPQSLPGVLLYNKKKFIDWYASIIVVLGSFLGIALGSYLVTCNYVSEENTYKFLTLMLIITSVIFTKQYLL